MRPECPDRGQPKRAAIWADRQPELDAVCLTGTDRWFGAGGDMDTCIALRTAVVKDGMLHVQAGGGVVLDSDAELELQETLHKSRALFRAASEAWRYA